MATRWGRAKKEAGREFGKARPPPTCAERGKKKWRHLRAGRMRRLPQGGLPHRPAPHAGRPLRMRSASSACSSRLCVCRLGPAENRASTSRARCPRRRKTYLHSFPRAPAFQNGGEILKESKGQGLCQ
ncbi:unnamed protein product [Rangifer tarandus platyrhynchus]|uniref:Uncharacterized protein n=1 Tax=Rangifer tarandus platyrhynchus TaxID=3082113 RepID=A0ABN8ZLZ8_RANTA|nr:unnamed protein product [Rangifer tarandus platyrhynchus]